MPLWISWSVLFSLTLIAGSYDPRKQSAAPSRKRMGDYAASTAGPDARDFVRVKCLIKQTKMENLAVACPPLPFKVTDSNGKEVRRVLSQQGEIKIRVEADRSFFLALDSEKYVLEEEKAGPFQAGDSALIHVRAR